MTQTDVSATPGAAARTGHPLLYAFAILAVAGPALLAYNVSPSATFLNQALSLLGFGLLGGWLAWQGRQASSVAIGTAAVPGLWGLPLAGACLAGAAIRSAYAGIVPASMVLSACSLLAVAAWTWFCGLRAARRSAQPADLFAAVCCGLFVAGLGSLLVGLIQVFVPELAVSGLIALPTTAGKAIGNVRQPNHLATILVWAIAAAVWLADRRRWPRWLMVPVIAAMVAGVVLTASRTGLVGVAMLAVWGLLDRQMSRTMRITLLAMPLVFAACWGGMFALSHLEGQAFAAEARLHSGSDISSSRFPVWRDTWTLVRTHPLAGVGWGNFNFAWSLTPFPERSIHFFDHTHNILVQFAVELGLPLTALVCALLGWALWGLASQCGHEDDGCARAAVGALGARTALMVVLMAVWHSQLEYPLWYAYFLLPAVLVWALAMTPASRRREAAASTASSRAVDGLMLAGAAAVCVGTAAAVVDYWAISEIFAPSVGAGPLEERIARGQRSPLFDYQADYAEATTRDDDDDAAPLATFRRPLHHLIDTRLMIAYARALHESGDDVRALFVVERLREFNRFRAEPFLDACNNVRAGDQVPFQCQPVPEQALKMSYEDFMGR